MEKEWVLLAKIGKAHGVKGAVRVWTYTEDPDNFLNYGPLTCRKTGEKFEILSASPLKDRHYIVQFKGILTRVRAESLSGTELEIPRKLLPPLEEEVFYHADLMDLQVYEGETLIGRVKAVHNYGAGDILEIQLISKNLVRPEASPTLSTQGPKEPERKIDQDTEEAESIFLPFTKASVPKINIPKGCLWIRSENWLS